MRTRKCLKWAALVAVPLVMALGMWPLAQRHRERARIQEATRALQAEFSKSLPDPDVMQRLIAEGADVNVRNQSNITLLHYVAYGPMAPNHGRLTFLHLLLAHGADINARASDGATPLMFAVAGMEPEIVRILIEHGAKVNLRRWTGANPTIANKTALTLARETLEVVQGYESTIPPRKPHEADPLAQSLNSTTRIIAMLKAAGAQE